LSFFSPLFKSEIKTPIYPLIFEILGHLRDQRVQTIFVSFSYSQVSGIMPLGSRFIGDVFVQILHRPEMLEQPIPNLWRERGNAFYLSEMIMARKAYDSLLKLAKTNTQDPSIHYALFSTSREVTALRPAALGHLAEAVQGDPVYAYEYLRLASLAREKGLNKEALNVLRLAHQALPDNPLVSLELARTLIVDGNTNDAVPLLEKLLTVQWSNIFYPGRRETLLRLRDAAGK
jgi:tetratricopeptide (TPR) repeat protein